jgi:hypothetical protein
MGSSRIYKALRKQANYDPSEDTIARRVFKKNTQGTMMCVGDRALYRALKKGLK